MIIEKDKIRGVWVVYKKEKSAKFEIFNSKLKRDCIDFIERREEMYLAKENAFNFMIKGDKKALAEKLHMDRGLITQVVNGKRTTKYLTAKAIVDEVCEDKTLEKYFDRVK